MGGLVIWGDGVIVLDLDRAEIVVDEPDAPALLDGNVLHLVGSDRTYILAGTVKIDWGIQGCRIGTLEEGLRAGRSMVWG